MASTVAESNIAEVTGTLGEQFKDEFDSIQNFFDEAQSIVNNMQEVTQTAENIQEIVEETVEVVEEVQENVRQTNYYSDSLQANLRNWVNPNATCWIGENGYSVECDY